MQIDIDNLNRVVANINKKCLIFFIDKEKNEVKSDKK